MFVPLKVGHNPILFNPVASTIQKSWMFKLPRRMQSLHLSTVDDELLYADRSLKDKQLSIRQVL
jgi:hypothetical protein